MEFKESPLNSFRDVAYHLKTVFYLEEAVFLRRIQQKERFLANILKIIHRIYKKKKTSYSKIIILTLTFFHTFLMYSLVMF